MELLFEHEAELRFYIFLGAFASFAVWETFAPRRAAVASTGLRWLNNFGMLAIGIIIAAWLLPALAVGSALIAEQRGWGLLNVITVPDWAAFLITFMFIDFVRYLQHWSLHRFSFLWRLHSVHHTDLDMDCTTAFRFHPIETIVTLMSYFLLLVALGAMPIAVLFAEAVFVMFSMFVHANTKLPLQLERSIRLIFVTPEMHRIHHSAHRSDHDRNFGAIFSFWDRIFKSYRGEPAVGHEHIVFGLSVTPNSFRELNMNHLLMAPFRKA